jgi:hypothetical protein
MAASAVDGASNTAVTNSVMCSLPSHSFAYVKANDHGDWRFMWLCGNVPPVTRM